MIPKTIHYCWFGRSPKPELANKCIESWKKYCPDYQIIEWNEDNYDISAAPLYVRQAYEKKKWAFVTDYVRLHIVFENGGVYLDTDVELRKSLDGLHKNEAYFGFENGGQINTGLGFGAQKGAWILRELMDDYHDAAFILPDGSVDTTTCPMRNTKIFLKHGLVQDDSMQLLEHAVLILPSRFLCPMQFGAENAQLSEDTISVHWFSSSWKDSKDKKREEITAKRKTLWHNIVHLPNRLLKAVIGAEKYAALKCKAKQH